MTRHSTCFESKQSVFINDHVMMSLDSTLWHYHVHLLHLTRGKLIQVAALMDCLMHSLVAAINCLMHSLVAAINRES
jgi:hypothetical protein